MKSASIAAVLASAAATSLNFETASGTYLMEGTAATATDPLLLTMGNSGTCTKIDGTDMCVSDLVSEFKTIRSKVNTMWEWHDQNGNGIIDITEKPQNCQDVYDTQAAGTSSVGVASGAHTIYPAGAPVDVYCQMVGSVGWTVIFSPDNTVDWCDSTARIGGGYCSTAGIKSTQASAGEQLCGVGTGYNNGQARFCHSASPLGGLKVTQTKMIVSTSSNCNQQWGEELQFTTPKDCGNGADYISHCELQGATDREGPGIGSRTVTMGADDRQIKMIGASVGCPGSSEMTYLAFRSKPVSLADEPKDCQDIYDSVSTTDGEYTIYPSGQPVQAYCEMVGSTGWTVVFSPDNTVDWCSDTARIGGGHCNKASIKSTQQSAGETLCGGGTGHNNGQARFCFQNSALSGLNITATKVTVGTDSLCSQQWGEELQYTTQHTCSGGSTGTDCALQGATNRNGGGISARTTTYANDGDRDIRYVGSSVGCPGYSQMTYLAFKTK